MSKLISMTEFVLQIDNIEPKAVNFSSITDIRNYQLQSYGKIVDYANFLSQPLTLGMFVPCDENNEPLDEPIETVGGVEMYAEKYQQAKDKVLFEGFEISYQGLTLLVVDNGFKSITFNKNGDKNDYETIQDIVKYNLTLTKK